MRLDVAYEAGELSAIREMVAAGLGVSVVPSLGLVDGPGPSAVTRSLDPAVRRVLALAVREDEPRSPAARAFLDLAAERPE